MANFTIDPVTGIQVPTPGVDPGTDYAVNVSNALQTLAHLTHTGAGNLDGYQIPAAGLNINGDVSFQNNNVTNLRSARLTSNGTVLSGVGDINCVYDVSGNLWFNNGSGTPVQLTNGSTTVSLASNVWSTKILTANYTINASDPYNMFRVISSGGAYTITLPAANSVSSGRFYVVWDESGDASTNTITIRTNGSDTIEGTISYILQTSYGSLVLVGDGTSKWSLQKWGQSVYNSGEGLTFNSGSTITMNGGSVASFGSGSFLDMNSGSGLDLTSASIAMSSGSGMDVNDTSQIIFTGTGNLIMGSSSSILAAGTTNITSGGTLGINSGATQHVKSGGNLYIDNGGTATVSTGGALDIAGAANLNVASGGNINVNSGGNLTVTSGTTTFNGNLVILEGGVALVTSGSGNFITVGNGSTLQTQVGSTINIHGTFLTDSWATWNTVQNRNMAENIWAGQDASMTPSNWVGDSFASQGAYQANTNAGVGIWLVPLARTHNGAVLSTIQVNFLPAVGHSGLPSQLPAIQVKRVNGNGTISHLSTTNTQFYPNPGSVGAYEQLNTLQYFTNQNNVIDNTNYAYFAQLTVETGTNALAGFKWCSVQCTYVDIPNQSWNI